MIEVRRYGTRGPMVALIHGGPGAPGDVASLAQALSDRFTVLEPLQRRSGGEPLTVARHVADLREVLVGEGARPAAVVGHSWGAMLALAYAAAFPDDVAALVLVAPGTFDRASRLEYVRRMEERLGPEGRARLAAIAASTDDDDRRLCQAGEVHRQASSFALVDGPFDPVSCDARGNRESWRDMLRLLEDGTYPAAFSAIRCPVLMLHGDVDPHPGPMIRDSLAPFVPQLEYVEFPRCGHYPWLERHARDVFLTGLRAWLLATVRGP